MSALRIAIAQIRMAWTTAQNLAAIVQAIETAKAHGAVICAFSELAVTGFHRDIAAQSRPELVGPAVDTLRALCARLSMAVAVGAPTFGADGARYNSHLLIDETGALVASIAKQGLTDPEATFFARGRSRPAGTLQGQRCTAVICREVGDFDAVTQAVPARHVDLIFLPGALRQDPAQPVTDPPEYVRDAQRLAAATQACVVQTNWPNALNRPEESVDGGQSAVIAADGELMFRLPREAAGLGLFTLGERRFDWLPQPGA